MLEKISYFIFSIMNIDIEEDLHVKICNSPWENFRGFLSVLKSKDSSKFPVVFNDKKKCKGKGIAKVPRGDFPIFGINPSLDILDLVFCDKCGTQYRLQNAAQHTQSHLSYKNSNDDLESASSNSLPSTPTKSQKKEQSCKSKKSTLSPPESVSSTILTTDTSSDADISSASGEISYLNDTLNISNCIVSIKTEENVTLSIPKINVSNLIVANSIKKIKKISKENNKEKKYSSAKLKVFDPNKHCGVCTEDNGWSPCLHSLTCKSHLISLRRSVDGRCKPFDELLLEHKLAKGNNINKIKKKIKEAHLSKILASSTTPAAVTTPVIKSQLLTPPIRIKIEHPSELTQQQLKEKLKQQPQQKSNIKNQQQKVIYIQQQQQQQQKQQTHQQLNLNAKNIFIKEEIDEPPPQAVMLNNLIVMKDEPMQVDEYVEQQSTYESNNKSDKSTYSTLDDDIGEYIGRTDTRHINYIPKPIIENIPFSSKLCKYKNQIYQSRTTAFWGNLFIKSQEQYQHQQQQQQQQQVPNTNTNTTTTLLQNNNMISSLNRSQFNINSINKKLYPKQFINLMDTTQNQHQQQFKNISVISHS